MGRCLTNAAGGDPTVDAVPKRAFLRRPNRLRLPARQFPGVLPLGLVALAVALLEFLNAESFQVRAVPDE